MWLALLLLAAADQALGHGRVLEPPSRASAWRYGFRTPENYDDDGVNCGGFHHQWSVNHGNCGICGDAYDLEPPRPHELGGVYGKGVIVGYLDAGSILSTTVEITAYHRGFWQFKICPDPDRIDQDCFDQYVLELEEGGNKYYPNKGSAKYEVNYRLPEGLSCDHCVLQWRYTAGNNWGVCDNGTEGLGCGNQETFGACSDISIASVKDNSIEDSEFGVIPAVPLPLPLLAINSGYLETAQGKEVEDGNTNDLGDGAN